MVNSKAIVSIVNKISKQTNAPCKKTLQKMVFLIQAKGVDLGCDYGIHFYGPYSSDLDFAVRELSDEGVLNIEYTSMEHRISIADNVTIDEYADTTIDSTITEFSKYSPSELELIATALYVYFSANKDMSKIKAGVIKIKGNKYSEEKIELAINELKKSKYIAA